MSNILNLKGWDLAYYCAELKVNQLIIPYEKEFVWCIPNPEILIYVRVQEAFSSSREGGILKVKKELNRSAKIINTFLETGKIIANFDEKSLYVGRTVLYEYLPKRPKYSYYHYRTFTINLHDRFFSNDYYQNSKPCEAQYINDLTLQSLDMFDIYRSEKCLNSEDFNPFFNHYSRYQKTLDIAA